MIYKFPVQVVLETDEPISPKELQSIRAVTASQMDYVLTDMAFISDCIQERISACLKSVHIESADTVLGK